MTPSDHISHDLSYFSGPKTSGATNIMSTKIIVLFLLFRHLFNLLQKARCLQCVYCLYADIHIIVLFTHVSHETLRYCDEIMPSKPLGFV